MGTVATTNVMIPCAGEFGFGEPTSSTGSVAGSPVVDPTSFFRFFGFLPVSEVLSSHRGRFFFSFFLPFSTILSSSLPSVFDPTVVTSMTGSSTRARWKPSIGAESTPSPVGSSEFALSLLSRFSKSRFCFHAIPFGSFVCSAPIPSMSSLWWTCTTCV